MENRNSLAFIACLMLAACGKSTGHSDPPETYSCSNLSGNPEGLCVEASPDDLNILKTYCGYLRLTLEPLACDRSLAARGCRDVVHDELLEVESLAVLDSWYGLKNSEECAGQTLTLTGEVMSGR